MSSFEHPSAWACYLSHTPTQEPGYDLYRGDAKCRVRLVLQRVEKDSFSLSYLRQESGANLFLDWEELSGVTLPLPQQALQGDDEIILKAKQHGRYAGARELQFTRYGWRDEAVDCLGTGNNGEDSTVAVTQATA